LVNGSTSALLFLDAKPAKPSPANQKFQVLYDAWHCNGAWRAGLIILEPQSESEYGLQSTAAVHTLIIKYNN
jgi:hypothetical protein